MSGFFHKQEAQKGLYRSPGFSFANKSGCPSGKYTYSVIYIDVGSPSSEEATFENRSSGSGEDC